MSNGDELQKMFDASDLPVDDDVFGIIEQDMMLRQEQGLSSFQSDMMLITSIIPVLRASKAFKEILYTATDFVKTAWAMVKLKDKEPVVGKMEWETFIEQAAAPVRSKGVGNRASWESPKVPTTIKPPKPYKREGEYWETLVTSGKNKIIELPDKLRHTMDPKGFTDLSNKIVERVVKNKLPEWEPPKINPGRPNIPEKPTYMPGDFKGIRQNPLEEITGDGNFLKNAIILHDKPHYVYESIGNEIDMNWPVFLPTPMNLEQRVDYKWKTGESVETNPREFTQDELNPVTEEVEPRLFEELKKTDELPGWTKDWEI